MLMILEHHDYQHVVFDLTWVIDYVIVYGLNFLHPFCFLLLENMTLT
jgi:hypothetical protein